MNLSGPLQVVYTISENRMDLFEKCRNFGAAREVEAAGLYPYFRKISSLPSTVVIAEGKEVIMIGSNNYLGLTDHPYVIEEIHKAVNQYGSGCTGSRFLNGTLDIHVKLEEELAEFMNREAALVFSTGFQTNLGTIATIVGKDDIIFGDRSNHASIVDGCRLSFGELKKYKHDDMADLERLLQRNNHARGKLIVTDGVFSMEGDIANLPAITQLASQYEAKVMVDDAHSIGVLGANGRGTAEHHNLEDKVDIIMGTFSKSFASLGGFIVSDEEVIHYIKHFSRALIFSASPPPAAVAAVRATLKILRSEPERRTRLWEITNRMHKEFKCMGYNIGTTQTPIIPLLIGDDMKTFAFWKALTEAGLFTNPVVSPAVPPGQALIRTSYTATHTDSQLDKVLQTFKDIGKQFGII
jgi:8-amino-7-oxononanoate synthase